MTAKLVFTNHAIARYKQRHARNLTLLEALRVLEEAAPEAVRLGDKSIKGDADVWAVPSLGIRLLVRTDQRPTPGEAPQNIVLTVLPQNAPQQEDAALIADLQAEARAVFAQVKAERDAIRADIEAAPAKSAQRSALQQQFDERSHQIAIVHLELVGLEHWARVLTTETKEREKTLRTQAARADEYGSRSDALRIAVNALFNIGIDNLIAHKALADISRINPGLVTDGFRTKGRQS